MVKAKRPGEQDRLIEYVMGVDVLDDEHIYLLLNRIVEFIHIECIEGRLQDERRVELTSQCEGLLNALSSSPSILVSGEWLECRCGNHAMIPLPDRRDDEHSHEVVGDVGAPTYLRCQECGAILAELKDVTLNVDPRGNRLIDKRWVRWLRRLENDAGLQRVRQALEQASSTRSSSAKQTDGSSERKPRGVASLQTELLTKIGENQVRLLTSIRDAFRTRDSLIMLASMVRSGVRDSDLSEEEQALFEMKELPGRTYEEFSRRETDLHEALAELGMIEVSDE